MRTKRNLNQVRAEIRHYKKQLHKHTLFERIFKVTKNAKLDQFEHIAWLDGYEQALVDERDK